MTSRVVLAAAAAVVMLASASPILRAQSAALVPSFVSETELVVMNVVVHDRRGTLVDGLEQRAFTVYENGVVRDIGLFAQRDEPITIGLIIDASGSMLANRTRLAYAAGQFARTGRTDDEVFALVVSDEVTPALPPDRPFTNDPDVLASAVMAHLSTQGRTAIWDGVLAGLEHLERGTHTRRALVVISDGQDNASDAAFEDVLARVRSSSAVVYAMGLVSPIQLERRPRTLRNLASASGGVASFPATHAAAFAALDTIARQIHSAYTLGFAPASRDGRYHQVRVTVRDPVGQRLDGRSRSGYQAGPAHAAR